MSEQLAVSLTREELRQLEADVRRTQEPFIALLVDLYSRAFPTIRYFPAEHVMETEYSPDVKREAERIRDEMKKAVEMTARYRQHYGLRKEFGR